MQWLADIVAAPVDRPHVLETTALGAAWLAGWQSGLWPDAETFRRRWMAERRFTPGLEPTTRASKLAAWADAVRRTRSPGTT
jgi:glycerol kinase